MNCPYSMLTLHSEGAPALIDLPADFIRPSNKEFSASSLDFTIDSELIREVKRCSAAHGVTTNMLFYSAWVLMLSKLSGQSDIVVGSPVANRENSDLENLIGFFVNTLALRNNLEGDPTVAELLQRIKEDTLSDFANPDIRFEKLVDELQPDRSLSYSPIFQVMYVFDNTADLTSDSSIREELPLLNIELEDNPIDSNQYDLTFMLYDNKSSIDGTLIYSTSIYKAETMKRWLEYYFVLLKQIISKPTVAIGELEMLSEAEKHTLIEKRVVRKEISNKLVHRYFEQQVSICPESIALTYSDDVLTYAELEILSNQLAHCLIENNVATGSVVAICIERSINMIVAMMAALKAGAAYVPIDIDYPDDRIQYILSDANPEIVLTSSLQNDRIGKTYSGADADKGKLICLDEILSNLKFYSNEKPIVNDLESSSLAYLIYTSGSTGQPKGVMLHHEGACNLAEALSDIYSLSQDSRVLQFASTGFDACTSEWLMALSNGSSLHLTSKDRILPGQPLADTLNGLEITHVTLPPSAVSALPSDISYPSLGTLIVAGEPCPEALAREWSLGRNFYNAYGPTEYTVCATVCLYDKDLERFNIGLPIINTQIYVVDALNRPVPTGVVGEILIGGPGVAKGYLNKPDLTEEKFCLNTIADNSYFNNYKLYRTGDLGRVCDDGSIEYIGRNDDQIKIRGFRVELGEIESVLISNRYLENGVVRCVEDHKGDLTLVAYFKTDERVIEDSNVVSDTEEVVNDLRVYLKEKLPDYMHPTYYIQIDSIPLTPNGKVNKKVLPLPNFESANRRHYSEPRTESENKLLCIWQRILQVEKIGRFDNFFELGGHSLLSTQLASSIKSEFSVDIPIKVIFEIDTLEEMASYIDISIASLVDVNIDDATGVEAPEMDREIFEI